MLSPQILAIINSIVISIGVYISFKVNVSGFVDFEFIPGSGLGYSWVYSHGSFLTGLQGLYVVLRIKQWLAVTPTPVLLN